MKIPRTASRLGCTWVVLCSAAVAGCGGGSSAETAHWQGAVTINGAPAPDDAEGSITFRPQSSAGKPITVRIEHGRFDSPATPKGKVLVLVDLQRPTGKSNYSERMGKDVPEMENLVPPEKSSGIELEVSGDKSDAQIDL